MSIWNWLFGKKKQQKKEDSPIRTIKGPETKMSPLKPYRQTPNKTSDIDNQTKRQDDDWSTNIANPMNPISPLWIGNSWDTGSNHTSSDNSPSYPSHDSGSSHHTDYSSHSSYDNHSSHSDYSSSSDSSSYDSGSSYDSSSSSDSSSW